MINLKDNKSANIFEKKASKIKPIEVTVMKNE